MRREDKEPEKEREWTLRPVEARVKVRCCRRDHIITINKKGRIRLEGHHGLPLSSVLQEYRIAKSKQKLQGCYYFVDFLLCTPKVSTWDFQMQGYQRRRSSVMVSFERAGIEEEAVRTFFRMALVRREHRRHSQNYLDHFEIPFAESAMHRIGRLYMLQHKREQEKKQRVLDYLQEQGFEAHKDAYRMTQQQW